MYIDVIVILYSVIVMCYAIGGVCTQILCYLMVCLGDLLCHRWHDYIDVIIISYSFMVMCYAIGGVGI